MENSILSDLVFEQYIVETNYAKMIGLDNTKWQDLFLPGERRTENNQQEGLQS